MTREKRWLDELPFSSAERELLLAGKSAQPPNGAAEADWEALCLALSAPTGVAAGGSAAYSASVKAASSGIVSKAGAGGLMSAATFKSFVVGVALGVGFSGTSAVVQHVSHHEERPATAADQPHEPARHAAKNARPSVPLSVDRRGVAATPPASAPGETPSRSDSGEPHATGSAPPHAETATPAATASVSLTDTSLSEQAHELAVVKRLLDAGAAEQALRRLQASFGAGTLSTLVEERDALYVQALNQAQRRSEARAAAQRFLDRYPRSPYLESMQRLVSEP